MTAIAWGVLYALVVVLLGYGLLGLVRGNERLAVAELAGGVLGLGLAGLGLGLFWLSLAGCCPSRPTMGWLATVGLVLVGVNWRRHRLVGVAEPTTGRLTHLAEYLTAPLALALITWGVVIVGVYALGHATAHTDGIMLWGFKARVVSVTPVRAATYFCDPAYYPLHLNYPLLVPFLMAGVNGLVGHITELLSKLPFVLCYVTLGLLLYGGLRRELPASVTLVLLGGYLTMPVLLRWAGAGLADVPLATFWAGALVSFLAWVRSGAPGPLAGAAVFAAAAAFTKNEGLPLLLLLAVAGLLVAWRLHDRRRAAQVLAGAGLALLLLLPWLLFRHGLPHWDEDYPSRLTWANLQAAWPRLGLVLSGVARGMFGNLESNLLWLLLVGLAVLGWRAWREPAAQALWLLLGGHLALYILVYLLANDPADLIPISLSRLLLHVSPTALLLCGLHLREHVVDLPDVSSTAPG